VQGDLEDPLSLERAARGVYGIYSVQDFWTVGAKREVRQGKNLADVAKKVGVEHFVYSSAGGAERHSGITHFETKWEIEKYIRSLKLPATVFRPAAFMETYHILEVEVGLLKGKLTDPIRGDKTYQTIATGSELTNRQAADVFSRVMNRPVKFQRLPMLIVRLFLGKEFYEMFHWFNTAGFQANIPELRRRYPEIRLHTLEEWLREDGWDKRGLRFRAPKD